MAQATLPSPIGTIVIEADAHHVQSVRIIPDGVSIHAGSTNSLAEEAARQIDAYFAGRLRSFDLPLVPLASIRGTALREAICAIPYGGQLSYGAVARTIDSGPRAIGQACRRNMMPIIIPCHRVTATGGIGFYSGGKGVETKIWLLQHESERV
ncbi:MAG: methylated-DNA--protein-cysteine methyltransferase [Rhizorhabdus sp.]|nr:methylated-DNA--protein-cysteine methyltransferase [Rhizorhabdus sp.]